jgi:hypothetical protein
MTDDTLRIAVIPDTQCKPGVPVEHLKHIGRYIAEKRPEIVVHLGDHADLPSLSSFDKRGSKEFEGRRYINDIAAAKRGMEALLEPIAKAKGYNPRLVLCYGNHENRINRAANDQAELDGLISLADLQYEKFGWETHAFLKPVVISGVVFCHYLVSGVMGRPIQSAAALLSKRHMSAVVGHQQGLQIATSVRADGALLTGVIAGSAYTHKENYLGPQGNNHYRGILFLNDVQRNGQFELMPLTLKYLKRRFA